MLVADKLEVVLPALVIDDILVVAGVAEEPLGLDVVVEVQDTAVGRFVTAFALQRLRAYVVAAC